MNATRIWAAAAAIALATGLGVSQDTDDSALEQRVVALEQQLEVVQTYLQAQAESAQKLSKALDASEEQGFTYGINPESRKTLLKGFRTQAAAAQKNLPGGKAAAADE